MADTYKVLGQVAPSATTLSTLYTVPALKQTVIAKVTVCNRGAATSFRLSVAVAGAADNNIQYNFYDVAIGANESIDVMQGVTIQPTDIIRCYATLATLTFNAFGDEQDLP